MAALARLVTLARKPAAKENQTKKTIMKPTLKTPKTANCPELPMSVIDQVISASHRKNRLAMIMGFTLGGFMPVASCVMKHEVITLLHSMGSITAEGFRLVDNANLWLAIVKCIIVLGCLSFSALTIFEWTRIAFKNPVKAIGFVLALDGVMVFSETPFLSYASLIILVLVNGIASGCKLALDRKQSKVK